MRRHVIFSVLIAIALAAPAFARNYLVRPSPTATVSALCARHGLLALGSIDDGGGSVYLVSASDIFTPDQVIADVSGDADVVGIEEDKPVNVPEVMSGASLNQSTTALLDSLPSRAAVNYFGATVLNLYASQPATNLINLSAAQTAFSADGRGMTVAIIDTGVDPHHPALDSQIVPGYDFVRNVAGTASEWADLSQSTTALLDQSTTALLDQSTTALLDSSQIVVLNQSTTALLDQSTTALLDTTLLPKAFGHGTMVAGIVHLTAPAANIMPLKAFTADGNANLSDIIQAIYYAADHGANVINMSFSLLTSSVELENAVYYAAGKHVTCIASTGNTGLPSISDPAAARKVIAVASTDNSDVRSLFSAYGYPTWVAAPGEGVVTTYPGGHYAAAWGTSFSAPFVAGGVALTSQVNSGASYSNNSKAVSHAKQLTPDLGYGRLDLYKAVQFAAAPH
jgi:subtilisin family serine protease